MNVPVARTRRFRCVFDLRRCRRHLMPSSVRNHSSQVGDTQSGGTSREDVDHSTVDQTPTDNGPLIDVKHFCKVIIGLVHLLTSNMYTVPFTYLLTYLLSMHITVWPSNLYASTSESVCQMELLCQLKLVYCAVLFRVLCAFAFVIYYKWFTYLGLLVNLCKMWF